MITIYTWFGYDLPIKELLRLIKQAGFDGAMVWWSERNGKSDYLFAPRLARESGLIIENIHAPFMDCNNIWLDDLSGNELADLYLGMIDDCVDYEIPTIVLHISSGDETPPYGGIGLDRIKRIVDKAERRGVNIAFENLRKAEYLDYVLGNIDSPRAGFCYDSGHHNCRGYPEEDLLGKYGDRLMALHLHDNDGSGDQHLLPFDGAIDWPRAMKEIAATGYKGAIALESDNTGYEELPPEQFLRLAFERAKKLESLA